MAGKYDKVLPGLKPLPVADPTYQEKVDATKLEIGRDPETGARLPASTLAAKYAALCAEDDEIKARQYDVNLRFAALEQLLTASQEAAEPEWGRYGVEDNALRLESGDTFRIQREPYGQVKDKEAFRAWCIANGYERQLQLWPTAMNAICKERVLEGVAPPDGCDTFNKVKVVYVPAKKGER